jgi:hypothetical protein
VTDSEAEGDGMKARDWVVVLGLALCAVALVACGGGSGDGASGGSGAAAEEEAALAFAECMRAHGAEVEDPKQGTNLTIGNPDDPTTKNALAACKGKLGNAGQELDAEEGEEFKEGWLAFAECVREHGVDMADPTFQGNGKVLLDRTATASPAFEAAREACQGKTLEPHGINIGG